MKTYDVTIKSGETERVVTTEAKTQLGAIKKVIDTLRISFSDVTKVTQDINNEDDRNSREK